MPIREIRRPADTERNPLLRLGLPNSALLQSESAPRRIHNPSGCHHSFVDTTEVSKRTFSITDNVRVETCRLCADIRTMPIADQPVI